VAVDAVDDGRADSEPLTAQSGNDDLLGAADNIVLAPKEGVSIFLGAWP
jgi:hypothetical protein